MDLGSPWAGPRNSVLFGMPRWRHTQAMRQAANIDANSVVCRVLDGQTPKNDDALQHVMELRLPSHGCRASAVRQRGRHGCQPEKNHAVILDPVNQQEVSTDMAFSVVGPIPLSERDCRLFDKNPAVFAFCEDGYSRWRGLQAPRVVFSAP
jgi:hypothetical protein